jgi:hypothetical protein
MLASSLSNNENTSGTSQRYTANELKQIQQLKARDTEVRAHEAAHIAAGGGIVQGGASFSFETGPDGIQYAIGGEVKIDTSKVSGDPKATLEKAQKIQRAALAPAAPSSQDRAVAAQAAQMAVEARAELNQTASDTQITSNNYYTNIEQRSSSTGNQIDIDI